MFMEKKKVLNEVMSALNKPDQPWEVTVEGDRIVACWKWMDAAFFSASAVTNEIRQFSFIVTLNDKGKWKELDKSQKKSSGVKMRNGKLSFGSSSSTFAGKTNQKSIQFGMGKNKQTGETGIVGFQLNSSLVKEAIRDYLKSCGWSKAGLFG